MTILGRRGKDGYGKGEVKLQLAPLAPPSQIPWETEEEEGRAEKERGTRTFGMLGVIRYKTRGQWPYRPAATRAMRNRHVMLYDLN